MAKEEKKKEQEQIQELAVLGNGASPNLIGIYGSYQKEQHVHLVMEDMDYGSGQFREPPIF